MDVNALKKVKLFVLWKGLDSVVFFFHFRTVFVYAVVSVSLADTVIKYDLNLGGLLTWFGLTPSPADYSGPPSRWPAAELSITVAQLFSFWEESPSLCGTASILELVSASMQSLRGKLKRRSQFCLNCPGPIGKHHKDHRCQWEPDCTSVVAIADYPKSWIVLSEWVLWKSGIVWLHRKHYLSQHERKTDCDNSAAPLMVMVTDDRRWCFIYPRKMRNTIIQSLYAHSIPPWMLK